MHSWHYLTQLIDDEFRRPCSPWDRAKREWVEIDGLAALWASQLLPSVEEVVNVDPGKHDGLAGAPVVVLPLASEGGLPLGVACLGAPPSGRQLLGWTGER
jgi:hypothetical protein